MILSSFPFFLFFFFSSVSAYFSDRKFQDMIFIKIHVYKRYTIYKQKQLLCWTI